MRFIHLADLHLGRSLAEFSLIDLQKEMLTQVVNHAMSNKVDAIVISGDIYDRSMPPVAAVNLLNGFLSALSRLSIPALIVAGNHDSPDRLAFLSELLTKSGIHICGEYRLGQPPVTLRDEYGEVDFHLLPFFRPGIIRAQAGDEDIVTVDDAVRAAVGRMPMDPARRNVLICHQFVCAGGAMPLRSESEMIYVGGTELVSASHFDAFDYVALGHLHQPQRVGSERVRYAGAPLKYALGETGARSFPLVEMRAKGDVQIKLIPFTPSINLRSVRGRFDEIVSLPPSDGDNDFLEVILTDEEPVYDAMQRLRARFPHTVNVRRERDMIVDNSLGEFSVSRADRHDPMAAFSRFAEDMTGFPLTSEAESDIRDALSEAQRLQEAEE